MNKKEFMKELNKSLENISLEESKRIINEIGDRLPTNLYEITLCIVNNNLSIQDEEINEKINYIKNKFKEIEDGNICFRCYGIETGCYPYYEEKYDYYYYPTKEMDDILNETYEFGKKLIYHKKYLEAINVLDLILYSKYTCEEVGNPEYDDSDEVYDCFDIDLEAVKHNLDFNLKEVYLHAIYALLAHTNPDKNEKIYKYLKKANIVSIEDVLSLGIEKIKDIDNFYKDWIKFLENNKEQYAKIILNKIVNYDKKD